MNKSLTLAYLYPSLMNVYGDRGNILCLVQRCRWRDIDLKVCDVSMGEELDQTYDLLFMGGGQDKEQRRVAPDLLEVKGEPIRQAVERGMVALTVCGGYQLFGRYYRPAEGSELEGIGVFDAWTIHKGPNEPRCIGNVVALWGQQTLVGFENHGGRTYLGLNTQPLARVVTGYGNNAEDKTEGAAYKNAFGTYLHGSFLPKNPSFADHLIHLALERKYGLSTFAPIDDALELRAHQAALSLTQKRGWWKKARA
ncbi:MAG: glutamine amidotransferase [Chloroflexi bacterium]|nr:glutamine amidotransferase [Chloroflexota bacterium]